MRKLAATIGLAATFVTATPVTLTSAGSLIVGNAYISPYTLDVGDTDYAAECFDLFDQSYVGQSWQANLLTLSDPTELYFQSSPNYLLDYEAEIWIFNQATKPGIVAAQQTALQYAAWSLFDPASPTNSLSNAYALEALSAAQQGLLGINLADYRFVESPLSASPRAQAFVIQVSEAPENDTWVYLGGGLVGVGLIGRKKRRC
jgi:hypothetical protein